jgi:hypothetical protein
MVFNISTRRKKMAKSKKKTPAKTPVKATTATATIATATHKATSDDKKIKILVTDNPKRGKSRDRFALYQNGQTVEQFVARIVKAGNPVSVARADLRWDLGKGLIAVQ